MKKIFCLSVIFTSINIAWALPVLNENLGKIIQTCKNSDAKRHVWLFKQWHLGAKVNTFIDQDFSKLAQEKNQTAIYEQLSEWIQRKEVETILAEGCQELELNEKSSLTINGWNILELQKAQSRADYSQIVSSVPLKIEAKFTNGIKTLCGDNSALIEKSLLAFSDARAAIGFLSRIDQYKSDEKSLYRYVDAAKEIYKLPNSLKTENVRKHIIKKLKVAVVDIEKSIEARNQVLLKKIILEKKPDLVVVFGGIHTPGLISGLEKNNINCSVVTPVGYQDNEVELLTTLKIAIDKL